MYFICEEGKRASWEIKTTHKAYVPIERNLENPYRVVTLADLLQVRDELLKELKYLHNQKHAAPEKQWLKSGEVQKLLQISPGTHQHLRDTGQLPFTKLGGIIYYEHAAIKEILANR